MYNNIYTSNILKALYISLKSKFYGDKSISLSYCKQCIIYNNSMRTYAKICAIIT